MSRPGRQAWWTVVPPVGERVPFVRRRAGRPWFTTFTLHFDGSCGFLYRPDPSDRPGSGMAMADAGLLRVKFHRDPAAWRRGLRRLREYGFVPLPEARRLGWVSDGWKPPPGRACSGF